MTIIDPTTRRSSATRKKTKATAKAAHAIATCDCAKCAAIRAEDKDHPTGLVGYARCSTTEQETQAQLEALDRAGCVVVFKDNGVSGSSTSRPELDRCLAALNPGDTLCVWALDRLGRSLPHLLDVLEALKARGVFFRSTTQGIDTNTPAGEMIYQILGAVAQFERAIIKERTRTTLASKRQRGERLGRKRALTPEQAREAREMLDAGKGVTYVARQYGVDPSTLWRTMDRLAAAAA